MRKFVLTAEIIHSNVDMDGRFTEIDAAGDVPALKEQLRKKDEELKFARDALAEVRTEIDRVRAEHQTVTAELAHAKSIYDTHITRIGELEREQERLVGLDGERLALQGTVAQLEAALDEARKGTVQ